MQMGNLIKKLCDKTFLTFIAVGVVNTLVGTGTMFLAYNVAHWSYWASSASNYVVGSIVSYVLNRRFTFKDSSSASSSIPRFIVNITCCYLLAYGAAKPLVAAALASAPVAVQENGAMLVGMCLFVLLNYAGQRYFVFKGGSAAQGRG